MQQFRIAEETLASDTQQEESGESTITLSVHRAYMYKYYSFELLLDY